MARRSDHTREELKELAVAAGQKIIANEGFSKFSTRKVAKEIGYTVGTLYTIFESHDDLLLKLMLLRLRVCMILLFNVSTKNIEVLKL